MEVSQTRTVTQNHSRRERFLEVSYERLRHASICLFVAILFFAAFPLGSARDWAWSPLAFLIGLIAIVYGTGAVWRPVKGGVPVVPLLPAAILFCAALVWQFSQTVPLHAGLAINPAIDEAFATLGRGPSHRIAVDPEYAHTRSMLWLCYGSIFLIVSDVACDVRQARRFLLALAASGTVVTLYSFGARMAAALKGGLEALIPQISDDFSGTFVNRNNYATYVGVCALIVIALIGAEGPSSMSRPLPFRLRLRQWAVRLSGATGVYLAMLTILLAGLLQSGSRGGMVAFMSGLVVFLLLRIRRPLLILTIVTLIVGLLMSLPSAHLLLDRFIWLAEGPRDERTRLYALTIEGISLRPWTGWGMGSFEGVYSLLQPLDLANFYYVMAHDSYLELALDLGVPAAAALPLAILWIMGRCAMGLRERYRHKEFSMLAISATVLVGVHSLFDFSLQLPAVAMCFATLLGVGWAQSWSTRRIGESRG
jgi:hypothetical protein